MAGGSWDLREMLIIDDFEFNIFLRDSFSWFSDPLHIFLAVKQLIQAKRMSIATQFSM
jgi:hypothetical protein